jgi:hypothetical protein
MKTNYKTRKGGANCRVGLLFPKFGGAKAKGLAFYGGDKKTRKRGGACACQAAPQGPIMLTGGYKPTKRNLKYLKKWQRGESIGFTIRSSLKAKGLIPRANGAYKVSPKYRAF